MADQETDLSTLEQEFLAKHGDSIQQAREIHAGCPDAQLILAAKGESLPEELRSAIIDHLDRCDSCRMLAVDLGASEVPAMTEQESARMRVRLEPAFANSRSSGILHWFQSRILPPLPVVAMVAVLVAVLGLLIYKQNTGQRETAKQVTLDSTPTTVAAALPLDKPEALGTQPQHGLVWRGAKSGAQSFAKQFDGALSLYEKNDYAGAAKKLEKLDKTDSRNAQVKFYDGICRLHLGDTSGAIRQLAAAKSMGNPSEQPEAAWYLAVAQQRAGHSDLALNELQELCKGQSSYSARACEAMKTR